MWTAEGSGRICNTHCYRQLQLTWDRGFCGKTACPLQEVQASWPQQDPEEGACNHSRFLSGTYMSLVGHSPSSLWLQQPAATNFAHRSQHIYKYVCEWLNYLPLNINKYKDLSAFKETKDNNSTFFSIFNFACYQSLFTEFCISNLFRIFQVNDLASEWSILINNATGFMKRSSRRDF